MTPNHRDVDLYGIITWPLCLVKYGRKFAVEFLFCNDMADLHRIKITDNLRNYYKFLEAPRLY